MSLNELLGSAISGLSASQAGLRSISNNIANVGTAGYARQRVALAPGVTGGRTSGVVIGEPERVADRFLEAAVYRRAGDMGRADVVSDYLDRLQGLLGTPDSATGLPARLSAISASAVRLTSGQLNSQSMAAFVGDVQDSLHSMRQFDTDVASLRADVESEVGFTVERINGLLARIHDLNDVVAQQEGLGRSSAGVVDQRLTALEELSKLVNVTVRDQPDGRVTIETPQGVVLLDKRLRQINYPAPGTGVDQPTYPPMDIRFSDGSGGLGPATGEKIDSAAVGGKLGGLLDLRDRALPAFSEKLGVLFAGLAETLNAAANAGTTFPPPATLAGGQTGLVGTDRLGFTGTATFAVTKTDGTLLAKTSVDFSALGPAATIDDAVAAINAGIAPAGTATFSGGKLAIAASAPGTGVIVAQDEASPSDRAGAGFSQFFGLNDMIVSSSHALVPSGFTASDPHGFTAGQTVDMVLRDSGGRVLARQTMTPATGGTMGDLVTQLNGGSFGAFGSFALDHRGRIQFQPDSAAPGAAVSIVSDSTDRFGTGRSFSALAGMTGASSGLSLAEVRSDIQVTPDRLPLARFQSTAALGARAVGPGDTRGAIALVDKLAQAIDLGKDGVVTLDQLSSRLLGGAGTEAARAQTTRAEAGARYDDAANRRDSFAGVNIDEELAQMVVFQNSYSAAARVITTANDMYDTLINMVR